MEIKILQDFRPCRLANTNVLFTDSEILDSEDDGATLLRNLRLTTWRHIPAYLIPHEKPSFTSVEFPIEKSSLNNEL